MRIGNVEFTSPNDLGEVLDIQYNGGKNTIIIRERGVERFTAALDETKCKLEVVHTFPRKIIDLRQVRYLTTRKEKTKCQKH